MKASCGRAILECLRVWATWNDEQKVFEQLLRLFFARNQSFIVCRVQQCYRQIVWNLL